MHSPHEARFWERPSGGRVRCTLCPHDCVIVDGARGACAVRYNDRGRLFTIVYDRVVSRDVDAIEKKPLFHFQPGSHSYSIATVGCNLRCAFCQNWQISQWPKDHLPKRLEAGHNTTAEPVCPTLNATDRLVPGEPLAPETLVEAAIESGCRSLSYTYIEPTIFYELAYDTAKLAREQGLKNCFVTNGFINAGPQRQLADVLDAVNVDLKFFKDETYRHVSRARLQPILDAIRLYRELGVWLEVTTLIIPDLNDSDAELTQIAEFVCSVGPETPWHVSAFYPAYHMAETPPTSVATLQRARDIGLRAGLRYVYLGNIPGDSGGNTYCYECGAKLIERYGFFVLANRISAGNCPECGTQIDGVELGGA